MRIRLIETGNAREDAWAKCWYTTDAKPRFAVPLLALPVVAALTPEHHQVDILDEKLDDVNLDAPADLVCFSFKTKDAKRTYRYSDELRKRGIRTILGGVHASLAPEEAAQHADAVVAGEAEGIWPQVLRDAEQGTLQKIYRAPKMVPLETAPVPRFDLLQNHRYWVHALQTSRGCLVGCEFCPIQRMFGGKSRHKPVERVMREVQAVQAIDARKDIFFTDEMFCGGDRKFQSELLSELRKTRVNFFCISDFKVMDREYILDLARSHCKILVINMPGTCFPHELEAIRAIRSLGIKVWGFFMFGFSFHKPDIFEKVVRFIRESGMDYATLTVITPFPNTPLAARLLEAGRLHNLDTDVYDQVHVTCTPAGMTAEELERGFHGAWKKVEDRFVLRAGSGHTGRLERWRRSVRRRVGSAKLQMRLAYDRWRGATFEPVNLEAELGTNRIEVAVTAENVLRK